MKTQIPPQDMNIFAEKTPAEMDGMTLAELVAEEKHAERRLYQAEREAFINPTQANKGAVIDADCYLASVRITRQERQYNLRGVSIEETEGEARVSFTASPYLLHLLEADGKRHGIPPLECLRNAILETIHDTERRQHARPAR